MTPAVAAGRRLGDAQLSRTDADDLREGLQAIADAEFSLGIALRRFNGARRLDLAADARSGLDDVAALRLRTQQEVTRG